MRVATLRRARPRLRLLLSGLMVLALVVPLGPASMGTSSVPADADGLALIDAHDHLQRNVRAEDLVRLMDLTGVSRMVLMALVWGPEYGSDDQALDYAKRYPGRFLPFIAFQTPGYRVSAHWLDLDGWALNRLHDVQAKLKGGGFFGIGEIILRHYDYSLPQFGVRGGDGEVDIPVDSPLMLRIAELATQYQVPIIVHAEGEPQVVIQMEHLLTTYPDAHVIWAHNCGRSAASEIRGLLTSHPNLFCDLAGMTDTNGYGVGWPRSGPWTFLVWDKTRRVFPDMKATFEAFPDRFLGVGTDSAHNGEWQYFVERIGRYRLLLSQLSAATAQKMAHENAERLFGLPPSEK